ncbi:uncharacterized protein LOC112553795 isoform X3 [Pomacea canaliculata]|uniref:uncharacterized protein LOC112553795 isoform X3 n=1 Tax=Pomacea canaliculata TaxID=400727 RepID=UPI000D72F6B8|nr:uncharacterized protein LOC112553795 isoform X3 [Pomacea canaliculata]
MHQFPLKVKGPVKRVPITDAGSSKIVPKPIKMKGNSETGMTSVPCEQSLIAPQLYRVVVLDELLKSYTLIPPAVPSTSCSGPLRLHEKGNHSSVKRQHQTWTATSDQHAAEFLCDVEVKQEVSSDQEGSPVLSLPLEDLCCEETCSGRTTIALYFTSRGVTINEACSHEIALLQPKCQLQSTTTLKKVLSSYLSRRNSENQDKHHISMINPAFIKKEPEGF